MNRIFEKPVLFLTVIVLLCGYLFFFRLGAMALTDPDETFYAQTAKEMTARNEWMTPYLYGKPQFEKPIFFYWLVEASYRVFGINEFAARFPSAVFALIGIIAVFLLGRLLFSERAGGLAALMLATNVEYVILSRACVTDMTLFTFMLLGALFFFYGLIKEKKRFYILSSAAFALATLTKGPVFLALPLAVIFIYLIWTKNLKAIVKMPLVLCILVFLAVAVPWYALMYKLHGMAFIDAFFGFHNVTRFLESEHKIGSQVYYNIPIILGGYFPWSIFLPFGLWHMFKKIKTGQIRSGIKSVKNASVFVLTWLAVIFLFFTVSSTKLPTYIFPVFMSLALVTAVLWDDFLKSPAAASATVKGVKVSYYLFPVIVIIGSVAAGIYIYFDYPAIIGGVIISCIFLVFGTVLSLAAFIRKRFVPAMALIIYALAIFLYPLSRLVLPVLERYETSKEVSAQLLSFVSPGDKIASESNYLAGLAFYTGIIPEYDIDRHHMLVQFFNSKERVWGVLKEKNHRGLYDPETTTEYVKPSYVVYRLGKRTLVTNMVPEGRPYLFKRERPK